MGGTEKLSFLKFSQIKLTVPCTEHIKDSNIIIVADVYLPASQFLSIDSNYEIVSAYCIEILFFIFQLLGEVSGPNYGSKKGLLFLLISLPGKIK